MTYQMNAHLEVELSKIVHGQVPSVENNWGERKMDGEWVVPPVKTDPKKGRQNNGGGFGEHDTNSSPPHKSELAPAPAPSSTSGLDCLRAGGGIRIIRTGVHTKYAMGLITKRERVCV